MATHIQSHSLSAFPAKIQTLADSGQILECIGTLKIALLSIRFDFDLSGYSFDQSVPQLFSLDHSVPQFYILINLDISIKLTVTVGPQFSVSRYDKKET